VKSDIEIAQAAEMKHIREIAESIGLSEDHLELYGNHKAKIGLDVIEEFKDRPNGKYIDVTAITPTPLGEGKTVTTIGLAMALNKIGKKTITCIRQPSLGPVFGIKGGAAGGGYSQVLPMEDFNLHLTGDNHAVSIAHNLLAAFLDTHLMKGNDLNIDPFSITLNRVVDVSDRALRNIIIGLGGELNGTPRETGYDISVASEVMAILALTTGLKDLRQKLAKMVIGSTYDGKAVTAEDLKAAGAMTVLLKDAIKPNLLQTIEHTPCLVHAGPFASALKEAADKFKDLKPLIHAATADNIDDMAGIVKETGCPIAVRGGSFDEIIELTGKLRKEGIKNIVIDLGSRKLKDDFFNQVMLRSAAIKKQERTLGYPTIVFADEMTDDPQMEAIIASIFVAKYGSIIVLSNADKHNVYPLLVYRQNIYTYHICTDEIWPSC